MTEQCNRCRFWREDKGAVDPSDEDFAFGICRRNPPRIIECMTKAHMVSLRYGQQEEPEIDTCTLMTCSLFPATASGNWCGQFAGQPAPAEG